MSASLGIQQIPYVRGFQIVCRDALGSCASPNPKPLKAVLPLTSEAFLSHAEAVNSLHKAQDLQFSEKTMPVTDFQRAIGSDVLMPYKAF